jgi:hypothetical protein
MIGVCLGVVVPEFPRVLHSDECVTFVGSRNCSCFTRDGNEWFDFCTSTTIYYCTSRLLVRNGRRLKTTDSKYQAGNLSRAYELQFDLARDVGLDYAPRQLFSSSSY